MVARKGETERSKRSSFLLWTTEMWAFQMFVPQIPTTKAKVAQMGSLVPATTGILILALSGRHQSQNLELFPFILQVQGWLWAWQKSWD